MLRLLRIAALALPALALGDRGYARDIGVCMVGQLRGICDASDLLSFFQVFLKPFKTADVILAVPEEECPKAQELIHVASQFAFFGGADVYMQALCLPEEMEAPEERLWMENFIFSEAGHRYFDYERLRNTLLPARQLAQCAHHLEEKALEADGQDGSMGYRWIARSRPDVQWHSMISREDLESLAPPFVLANWVPMPIQGVVEDQFLLGSWSSMREIFRNFFRFLLSPRESWSHRAAPPWCVEHATLRSRETCENLYTENLLESFLRSRPEAMQLRKMQGICFDKIAPCRRPRTNYCDMTPPRHVHGYVESDPAFFEQFNMDYFLTASATNADFDGQFAVRLARFFRDDVDRNARRAGQKIFRLEGQPARPGRVLDMGCGRGSFVELFERFGLVAIGIDGDPIVHRTLPKNSLVWDLTEPLDLPGIRASEAEGFRSQIQEWRSADAEEKETEGTEEGTMEMFLSQIEAAADDQTSTCSFEAPDEPTEEEDASLILSVGLKMQGTGEGHSVALLRHICCSDVRCVGYGMGVSYPPIGTVWRKASSEGEDPYNGTRPSFFYGLRYLRRKTWPTARAPGVAARQVRIPLPDSLLQKLGVLTVCFGSADWVLSLGVGQFIPRSKELTFLMNLVRHAEFGIVMLWGRAGPNPRSAEEVQQLFSPLGFFPDEGAARELRLFAGLAYGGPKAELLVLRRLAGTWSALDPWQREDVYNSEGRGEPAVLVGHHAYLVQYRGKHAVHCAVHETYGLVRPGLLWVNGGCGCLFRVWRTNNVRELPGAWCINADHRYKECLIPSWLTDAKVNVTVQMHLRGRQNAQETAGDPGPVKSSPAELDWQMHASADQLVPRLTAWRGDPRMNMVFYKFAKKLASACQTNSTGLEASELLLEWQWFWSADWRPLLRLSAQLQGRQGWRGWRGRGGVEPEVPTRFARIFLLFRSLGLQQRRERGKSLHLDLKLRARALGHFRRAVATAESALKLQLPCSGPSSGPSTQMTSPKPRAGRGGSSVAPSRWAASDCLPRWRFRRDRKKLKGPAPPEAVLRRFALAQKAAATLLVRLAPARALRSQVLLELLILAHRAAMAVVKWGKNIPCRGLGHLQKRPTGPTAPASHRPVAKPFGCDRPWAKDSVEAWYIYRLVACDPSST